MNDLTNTENGEQTSREPLVSEISKQSSNEKIFELLINILNHLDFLHQEILDIINIYNII